jgi:hypothetical protein
MVVGGEVRGQETLLPQKSCKTLIWVSDESCESVTPEILKKSKIRYTSQVIQVSIFQTSRTSWRVQSTIL